MVKETSSYVKRSLKYPGSKFNYGAKKDLDGLWRLNGAHFLMQMYKTFALYRHELYKSENNNYTVQTVIELLILKAQKVGYWVLEPKPVILQKHL